MLEGWLEFHRTTLLLKCEPMPTSELSLHGLVRHMAEVERNWFARTLLNQPVPPIWFDPAEEDSELVPLDAAEWDSDLAVWTTPAYGTATRAHCGGSTST